MKSDHAPNDCPECGEPAYVGMNEVECTYYRCTHFHEKTWERHVMSLPDTGDPEEEYEIEDAPTQPKLGGLELAEYLRTRRKVAEAIDTTPVPCYTVPDED